MLAKLTGRDRENVTWDDVESCYISLDAIKATGVKVFQDGKGETLFPDVNAAHWAAEEISVSSLFSIVNAAVTPLNTKFIGKYELVATYDHLVERKEIAELQFGVKAMDDLSNVREHKMYTRKRAELVRAEEKKALAAPPVNT